MKPLFNRSSLLTFTVFVLEPSAPHLRCYAGLCLQHGLLIIIRQGWTPRKVSCRLCDSRKRFESLFQLTVLLSGRLPPLSQFVGVWRRLYTVLLMRTSNSDGVRFLVYVRSTLCSCYGFLYSLIGSAASCVKLPCTGDVSGVVIRDLSSALSTCSILYESRATSQATSQKVIRIRVRIVHLRCYLV